MNINKTMDTVSFKDIVKQYIEIDDSLKQNAKQVAESKKERKELTLSIIDFLDKHREFEKVKTSGGGYLSIKEKQMKVPYTKEEKYMKLEELIRNGIKDPKTIFDELNKGAGTKTEIRLIRRCKPKQRSNKRQKTQ